MVPASYLYSDADGSHFLDQETFETLTLSDEMVGDALDFLVEGAIIQLHKYNGNPIGLQLPIHVELAVTYTEPAVRGDTASGSRHQAGQAGDRHRDPRTPLHQGRRKDQGVHRDSRVRRPRLTPQPSPFECNLFVTGRRRHSCFQRLT